MSGVLGHVLDSINQAVAAFDDELRLVAANRRFVELLGLPEELGRIGARFEDLIRYNAERGVYDGMSPDEAVAHWVGRVRAGGESAVMESPRPNGAVVEIQRTRMPGGGFVLTYIDVTERRRRERMLEESRRRAELAEARLRDAIESLPEAFALFDADDRLVVFNSPFVEMFGHIADKLAPGVTAGELVRTIAARGAYPTDQFASPEAYVAARLARRHRDGPSTSTYRNVNGQWVRSTETPLRSGGWTNVWVDISALKEKERALEQQSRHLEAILAHAAQGVNILDDDMHIVAVNDGFMQFYGFPPELGRPGTHVAEFIRHRLARGERYEGAEEGAAGGDVEAMVARRIEALRRCRPGEPTVHEETRPDGRVIEVRRTRLADGTLISTYTDVTERVRAQEALRES
ncbi:MAG TPA: PAS-domain containing protein, partial [Geminicoccaceae bacterium]|nr:PAS-domain containing protein [Geminicoccaceae bacterium]